ncbi:hypothetical protein [Paenibacillus sp. YIM B09110]|uniref:hypothetical protein n=1 Tax=Paenibacillus sp. YIM B09110 TaxID=3126102 RepID=UPI00301D08EE
MLTKSDCHLSFLSDQELSDSLTITRIELFVIPALAVDSSGYRVCLRMLSNKGVGWGEFFAPESDSQIDLKQWSEPLRQFVGAFTDSASLYDSLLPAHVDGRLNELFCTAIDDLLAHTDNPTFIEGNTEETVLKNRSVAYVSIH